MVTAILANKFVSEGYGVSLFVFQPAKKSSIEDRLDKRVRVCVVDNLGYSKNNVRIMRSLMQEQQIHIVIKNSICCY